MTNGYVFLAFEPFPVDAMGTVNKLLGKGAVVDADVARMAGAIMAAGDKEALAALRERLEAGALKAVREENPELSKAAARWLAGGERGVSSNTMFTVLTGVNALGEWPKDHPYDPDDFRRCRKLLDAVPELKERLPLMATVSAEWEALVAKWDDICWSMDNELPERAYTLIKRALEEGAIKRKAS